MGAGILPAAIWNGKLYFLFGKENNLETSAPGYSDFGGGPENNETKLQTAIREIGEEMTGFMGTDREMAAHIRKFGFYQVDTADGHYRTHIVPTTYDANIERYFNNTRKYIHTHLDKSIIKQTTIFEKEEIKWVCIDDLATMRPKFRRFYWEIVNQILSKQSEIRSLVGKKKKTRNRRGAAAPLLS